MLESASGNLLEADVDALVNTVNCVGFMGKGIALQFKQAFPENFRVYEQACKRGEVEPGRILIVPTGQIVGPKYIFNFPTKRHWKGKSRIEDIRAGLPNLIQEIKQLGIESIAVPPLGCGLGGLDWDDVRPLIESAFADVPHVRTLVYSPNGAPDPKRMPVRTKPASMTRARALFIQLMDRYAVHAYRLTQLEIQKLAYLLQHHANEPLRLQFQAHYYGPYAENLNKVLQAMEGHFTRGYGDQPKPDNDIELLPGAVEAAAHVIQDDAIAQRRLEAVTELIDGFETPYAMELLASVHWVAHHGASPATDVDSAIRQIHDWNPRKKRVMKQDHIRTAWDRLVELKAIPNPA